MTTTALNLLGNQSYTNEGRWSYRVKLLWDQILNCATIGKIILSFFDFMN
jgi:hypothetical protein